MVVALKVVSVKLVDVVKLRSENDRRTISVEGMIYCRENILKLKV